LYPLVVDQERGGLPGDQKTKSQAYNTYVSDYCDHFKQALPARSEFIRSLLDVYQNAAPEDKKQAVKTKCEKIVGARGLLNTWFDPIDPLGRLSATEICETQFNIILKHVSPVGVPSLAACVTTSYLTSVKIYCRQYEESDYEDCVNVEA